MIPNNVIQPGEDVIVHYVDMRLIDGKVDRAGVDTLRIFAPGSPRSKRQFDDPLGEKTIEALQREPIIYGYGVTPEAALAQARRYREAILRQLAQATRPGWRVRLTEWMNGLR